MDFGFSDRCGSIEALLKRHTVTQRDLLSLIGKLRWAANAIFPGQAFVRHLEKKAYSVSYLRHHVNLNKDIKTDLEWWIVALRQKMGIPFSVILKSPKDCDLRFFTDASDFGIGGWSDSFQLPVWFSEKFIKSVPNFEKIFDIQWRELAAILVLVMNCGHLFHGKAIHFICDNASVVGIVANKRAPLNRPDLMLLIRIMSGLAAKYRFYFWIEHISTEDNFVADKLSRVLIRRKNRSLPKWAREQPLHISRELQDLVRRIPFKKMISKY